LEINSHYNNVLVANEIMAIHSKYYIHLGILDISGLDP